MPRRTLPGPTRSVACLIYPDIQVLDAVGPLEVFSTANRLKLGLPPGWRTEAPPPYRLELVARDAGPVRTSAGYALQAQRSLRGAKGPYDTVLVAGGDGSRQARRDPALLRWLRRQAGPARRVAGVCTGAFLLAEAGLLDGRRATTHWSAVSALSRSYPSVDVEPDPIFVRDGKLYTSAGVTAGMDLALALVEEDLGREAALDVARRLVLFLKRPGGQSQFSAPLAAQGAERAPLRDLQSWVPEHLGDDLSVPALARRAGMSPRNFARVFTREVGVTPARFVEEARVEAARRALEDGEDGVEAIASHCGFHSAEVMRRAFVRLLRVGPAEYRQRFRSARVA